MIIKIQLIDNPCRVNLLTLFLQPHRDSNNIALLEPYSISETPKI